MFLSLARGPLLLADHLAGVRVSQVGNRWAKYYVYACVRQMRYRNTKETTLVSAKPWRS